MCVHVCVSVYALVRVCVCVFLLTYVCLNVWVRIYMFHCVGCVHILAYVNCYLNFNDILSSKVANRKYCIEKITKTLRCKLNTLLVSSH